jgi:hypothetical protein
VILDHLFCLVRQDNQNKRRKWTPNLNENFKIKTLFVSIENKLPHSPFPKWVLTLAYRPVPMRFLFSCGKKTRQWQYTRGIKRKQARQHKQNLILSTCIVYASVFHDRDTFPKAIVINVYLKENQEIWHGIYKNTSYFSEWDKIAFPVRMKVYVFPVPWR